MQFGQRSKQAHKKRRSPERGFVIIKTMFCLPTTRQSYQASLVVSRAGFDWRIKFTPKSLFYEPASSLDNTERQLDFKNQNSLKQKRLYLASLMDVRYKRFCALLSFQKGGWPQLSSGYLTYMAFCQKESRTMRLAIALFGSLIVKRATHTHTHTYSHTSLKQVPFNVWRRWLIRPEWLFMSRALSLACNQCSAFLQRSFAKNR